MPAIVPPNITYDEVVKTNEAAANVLVGGNLRACRRWFRYGLNVWNRHSGVCFHVINNQNHSSPNQIQIVFFFLSWKKNEFIVSRPKFAADSEFEVKSGVLK